MSNNLFNFATSELSQDAVIAWLFNWFNDESNAKLHELSRELVQWVSDIPNKQIKSVKVFRQLSSKVQVEEKALYVKIDVLVIVNDVAVIIEDKTFTHEHSAQIDRYKQGLERLIDKNEIRDYNCKDNPIKRIITVFLKTGFYDDHDKSVIADKCIKRSDLLEFLKGHIIDNSLYNDYCNYLKDLEEKEIEEQQYEKRKDDFKSIWDKYSNYTWSRVGQYSFLNDMRDNRFKLIKGKIYELYQIYSGSSAGRPWTEMIIHNGTYQKDKKFEIFWRADTDSKGPYISLRLYENKEQYKTNKDRHREKWEELIEIVKETLSENPVLGLDWREVNPGYKGNYNEASVFHLHLDKYFKCWKNGDSKIIEKLLKFNDSFLENLNNAENRDN